MEYTLYIFIAITGAAALGFLAAWTIQMLKIKALGEENQELNAELKDQELAFNRMKAQNEAHEISVKNLQNLLEEIENQAFTFEKNFKQLKLDHEQLSQDYQYLVDHPAEKLREIEVIREVPVLIFRDRQAPEGKREKAKKLVKAFKKGYLHRNEEPVSPKDSEIGE
jgi:hypothetical protein